MPSPTESRPPWSLLVLATVAAGALFAGLLARELDRPAPLAMDVLDTGPSPWAVARAAKDEARADLAAGRPRWLTYGYPAAARWDYADLLEERYGIELEAIAGCVIDGEISTRAAAYDSVIERWLRETYPGRDVLAETWADAETRWRERVSARQPRDEVEAAILAVLEEVDLSALLGPEEPEGEPLRADEPDGSPRRGSRARRRARRASRAARR